MKFPSSPPPPVFPSTIIFNCLNVPDITQSLENLAKAIAILFDGGTQFDIEATYNFPVNDNLSIFPAFYYINSPNNFEDNPDIYVGNVRMQFRL